MVQPGFNEKVKRNVADVFDISCRIYQEFEDKHRFFASLALKLAESIDLQQNTMVLDVGCGNGISAQALNKHYSCRVIGIDLSEKMVEAGKLLCNSQDITLLVGDGENLADIAGKNLFDYVLYNASIFIFPDVEKTLSEAYNCLRPGGKIAFSFYPNLTGETGEDILNMAFERLGEPPPRFRVITDYDKACRALSSCCGNITTHEWIRPFETGFLKDFFSIPAQSASLFPGREYEARRDLVHRLFETLSAVADRAKITWRMAEGTKPYKNHI